ncbi:hypothetical protein DFR52_106233 [Hoeflea marina]|uniref:Uncharacterized protein n=1 Tax=Hoeflea marina TaxID=274592 RepID=A0A317PE12_9HYPH|nr:hypothetical protein [Hoeflea marina]PWV97708.1 hypothetical protein DFR52_106233 [Hoeflea marina]
MARSAKSKLRAEVTPKPADHGGAYKVTALAGPRVAGRPVKPGDLVHLRPVEAAHELRIGAIEVAREASSKAD